MLPFTLSLLYISYLSLIFGNNKHEWDSFDSALNWINSVDKIDAVSSKLLEKSIEHNWWSLSAQLIQWGKEADMSVYERVKNSTTHIKDKLDQLLRSALIEEKKMQKFSPAFQWAESPTHVHLQIKLAYRWSSPGSLSVENETIEMSPTRIYFSGIGVHSNIKKSYALELNLIHEINVEQSEYFWGSVGKLTMILKKKMPQMWNTLTQQKISNMYTWFEMKAKFEQQKNSTQAKNPKVKYTELKTKNPQEGNTKQVTEAQNMNEL